MSAQKAEKKLHRAVTSKGLQVLLGILQSAVLKVTDQQVRH